MAQIAYLAVINVFISANAALIGQMTKSTTKTVSATSATLVSRAISFARSIATYVIPTTDSSKTLSKSVSISTTAEPTLTQGKSIARQFTTTASTIVSAAKSLLRTIGSTASALTSTSKVSNKDISTNATTAQSQAQGKQLSNTSTATTQGSAKVNRSLVQNILGTIGILGFVETIFQPRTTKKNGGGGAGWGSFANAQEVRRRNKEIEEKKKTIRFQISYLGQIVSSEKEVSDTQVSVSINIMQVVQEALVKIKSIFIRETKGATPSVQIKKDQDD